MEETRQLILRSQGGDFEARSRLVEENLPLVYSVVHRFQNRGLEYDDLVQIGSLGLLKAIKDFNLDYQVRFSTYAVPKIMGEIKQHLRQTSPLRVARPLKKLASAALSVKDDLTQKYGRTPTVAEIAHHLEVAPEELVAALDAVAPVFYLQEKIDTAQDQPREFQDLLATYPAQEEFLLKQALLNLEPEERRLILLRYFAERSQKEVARILGISQAQVSRMEARIVGGLRQDL